MVVVVLLATFGNHIGANVELADLDTSLTAHWVDSSSHRLKKLQVLLRSDKQYPLYTTVIGVTLDGHKLDSAFQG